MALIKRKRLYGLFFLVGGGRSIIPLSLQISCIVICFAYCRRNLARSYVNKKADILDIALVTGGSWTVS